MLYREFDPGPILSPFIRCFWILEAAGREGAVERVVPDGSPEIVIHYGDPFEKWHDDIKRWEQQKRLLIIGQATRSILLRPERKTGVIGVRFKPYGAFPFLGLPMNEFTNQILSPSDLCSPHFYELTQRIGLAKDNRERITILKTFFQRKLQKEPDGMLAEVVRYMNNASSPITVRNISKRFNTTERSLQRKFEERVGLSPKQFAKIVRFGRALKMLQTDCGLSLTEIAQDSGYFDQSHFIHDFKGFAAITPSDYRTELHELSDYFHTG